jgi:phenylacetate-coenzyme A ligase PaaK-like adenylate-forming protein
MKLDRSKYEPFGIEAIETASRDEIAALQTLRLKRTLQNVYENVPLYRRKFDAAGISPLDFKHLDDLKHFPFTTKQDLRENYPFGMFAVPRERVLRIHASSGTTATPAGTSTRGRTLSHARCAHVASAPACLFISLLATVCSPAEWECTTVPSGLAAR